MKGCESVFFVSAVQGIGSVSAKFDSDNWRVRFTKLVMIRQRKMGFRLQVASPFYEALQVSL
ncbi:MULTISPECIES: hypothetical protein [Bacillus cereus group]|uniref:hypothetical protein n=1 Tax=Bacillus cereus group TaxID=86661 RepID=UPI0002F59BFB|nr:MULTISPECIES: hypothetical protein [Bacillus cereus group]MEB9631739.1 hypothetical protein [Bacillus anthracis]